MAVADPIQAEDPLREHKAILSLTHKFLPGISLKDPALMHSFIFSTGHALLIRTATTYAASPEDTKNHESSPTRRYLHLPLPQIISRIPFDSSFMIEENIVLKEWEEGDDGDKYKGRKTKVRVYDDIGFAWTPFETRFTGVVQTVVVIVMTFVRRLEEHGGEEWEWAIHMWVIRVGKSDLAG
ncbi:hypothetical protein WAI453_005385 [Rhynchosporium graminicola]|uniref:Uncharacterized protein n=1 Tax=Rhynchosporium graminicola TaxID=2792576 RepID=A0A1E1LRW3_9HELO|nr:uncharacterized protein RCO7_05282 [Rhynchosporium commune]